MHLTSMTQNMILKNNKNYISQEEEKEIVEPLKCQTLYNRQKSMRYKPILIIEILHLL